MKTIALILAFFFNASLALANTSEICEGVRDEEALRCREIVSSGTFSDLALKLAKELLQNDHSKGLEALEVSNGKFVSDEGIQICEAMALNSSLSVSCLKAIAGVDLETQAVKVCASFVQVPGNAISCLETIANKKFKAASVEFCQKEEPNPRKVIGCLRSVAEENSGSMISKSFEISGWTLDESEV